MYIAVVGINFIGLTTALTFAKRNRITLIDNDVERVELINKKISPIDDKDIANALKDRSIHLFASDNAHRVYRNADLVIIALEASNNSFEMDKIEEVIKDISDVDNDIPIIIKSTLSIGQTRKFKEKYDLNNLFYCPDFLEESQGLQEIYHPTRVIFGIDSLDMNPMIINKYLTLLNVSSSSERFILTYEEAEATKLFANAYLALRMAYFNELDSIMEEKGLRSKDVIDALSHDLKIGNFYNNPNFGYDGYNLPKDSKELKNISKDVPNDIINSIISSNVSRKKWIANQILNKTNKDEVVGVYRLVLKNNISYYRNSSINDVIDLIKKERKVVIYEPLIKEDNYLDMEVIHDLNTFKSSSNLIITNNFDKQLNDVKDKVYTRDILFNK
ncbi:MAG: nucleotide sugar dehydrogenase [Bacilli bacterium]|nr:nucleotide sugar dehydrogenase [Bacilli bacterium]